MSVCLSDVLSCQPVWAAANGVSQRQHWVCASAASILRQHLHPFPPCSLIRSSSVFVFLVRLQKCKAKTDKQNAKQKWRKETAISFVWVRFLTVPPPLPMTPIRLLTLSLFRPFPFQSLFIFVFFFFFWNSPLLQSQSPSQSLLSVSFAFCLPFGVFHFLRFLVLSFFLLCSFILLFCFCIVQVMWLTHTDTHTLSCFVSEPTILQVIRA